MQVAAKLRFARLSPQKARLVVDEVRGKSVSEALDILRFMPQKATQFIIKLINSAIANAENNFGLDVDELRVAKICVDQGPRLKRTQPRAKGRACRITKPMSHILVVLEDNIDSSESERA